MESQRRKRRKMMMNKRRRNRKMRKGKTRRWNRIERAYKCLRVQPAVSLTFQAVTKQKDVRRAARSAGQDLRRAIFRT